MDRSSPFSSQSRSFRFLFEPIRASTEKACARELRATADLLLSLILAARAPAPARPRDRGSGPRPHAPSARPAGPGRGGGSAGPPHPPPALPPPSAAGADRRPSLALRLRTSARRAARPLHERPRPASRPPGQALTGCARRASSFFYPLSPPSPFLSSLSLFLSWSSRPSSDPNFWETFFFFFSKFLPS